MGDLEACNFNLLTLTHKLDLIQMQLQHFYTILLIKTAPKYHPNKLALYYSATKLPIPPSPYNIISSALHPLTNPLHSRNIPLKLTYDWTQLSTGYYTPRIFYRRQKNAGCDILVHPFGWPGSNGPNMVGPFIVSVGGISTHIGRYMPSDIMPPPPVPAIKYPQHG